MQPISLWIIKRCGDARGGEQRQRERISSSGCPNRDERVQGQRARGRRSSRNFRFQLYLCAKTIATPAGRALGWFASSYKRFRPRFSASASLVPADVSGSRRLALEPTRIWSPGPCFLGIIQTRAYNDSNDTWPALPRRLSSSRSVNRATRLRFASVMCLPRNFRSADASPVSRYRWTCERGGRRPSPGNGRRDPSSAGARTLLLTLKSLVCCRLHLTIEGFKVQE